MSRNTICFDPFVCINSLKNISRKTFLRELFKTGSFKFRRRNNDLCIDAFYMINNKPEICFVFPTQRGGVLIPKASCWNYVHDNPLEGGEPVNVEICIRALPSDIQEIFLYHMDLFV